jgi:hypothetical protein
MACIRVFGADSLRPNVFGLFGYSRGEVDDRIALIDAALAAGASDRDVAALHSARRKPAAWRERLGLPPLA